MTYRASKIVFLFVALFIGMAASASAGDSTTALAQQFVEVLRYKDQFQKYQEECLITQRTISPEALVSQNENYFGGIRQGDPKWGTIVSAYDSYFQDVCSRPTEAAFLAALSASYAETMSAEQLKQAIQFYSSPTGQVLVAANMRAVKKVYEIWTMVNSEHLVEATARFQKTLAILVQSR